MTDPEEKVNHPRHYNALPACCLECHAPIECIDVVEHFGFNIGSAIKYLWRHPHKGAASEDLKKAIWYIQREIEKSERDALFVDIVSHAARAARETVQTFSTEEGLVPSESEEDVNDNSEDADVPY